MSLKISCFVFARLTELCPDRQGAVRDRPEEAVANNDLSAPHPLQGHRQEAVGLRPPTPPVPQLEPHRAQPSGGEEALSGQAEGNEEGWDW